MKRIVIGVDGVRRELTHEEYNEHKRSTISPGRNSVGKFKHLDHDNVKVLNHENEII